MHLNATETAMTTATTHETVHWREDIDSSLADAKKSAKTALLDFTAAPM